MLSYAGQAILHATIAALVIEALLRLWRVDEPGERLALRWVAMTTPATLTLAYVLLAPARSTAAFAEGWALFAGMHWNELRVGGTGIAWAATVVLSLLGTAFYLRDAVPFLGDRVVRRAPENGLPADHPACRRVRNALSAVADVGPGRPSAVIVVDLDSPVLLCSGIDQTTILVSTGALARLDDEHLVAALAHEVAHLLTRDPFAGWWLIALRTVQFFNPVVQIVARQAVQELEHRADVAVARQGLGRGLAAAVQRLSIAPEAHSDLTLSSEGGYFASGVLSSAHRRAADDRCQRLLENALPALRPFRAWRFGLSAAALAALLFLVV